MSESADISVSGAPDSPRERRTQDERTAETRTRVLDAAIDCLIDEGYAGTTTKRIAERTGISRGAQQHHFPKRHDLVIQAMTHLANRRLAELRADAQRLTDVVDRVERLLDLLQQSVTGPVRYAAIETGS